MSSPIRYSILSALGTKIATITQANGYNTTVETVEVAARDWTDQKTRSVKRPWIGIVPGTERYDGYSGHVIATWSLQIVAHLDPGVRVASDGGTWITGAPTGAVDGDHPWSPYAGTEYHGQPATVSGFATGVPTNWLPITGLSSIGVLMACDMWADDLRYLIMNNQDLGVSGVISVSLVSLDTTEGSVEASLEGVVSTVHTIEVRYWRPHTQH